MSAPRPRPYRRTKWIAAGSALALALTYASTGRADSQESFNGGTGTATALGYKVNPLYGNLSFGITAGTSIAGHQNTVAQGISQVLDLGLIGMTLAGEGCDGGDATLAEEDQPQPLIAESTDPKYNDGETVKEDWGGLPSGTKYAEAKPAPFARAVTELAPMGDKAVAYVGAGRTITSSGVVGGATREVTAVTEISEVSFLNGIVKIGDMRWEAIHRSGGQKATDGTFEIGSLAIDQDGPGLGKPQKVALPSDAAAQMETVSKSLAGLGLGFDITAPKVRVKQGIVFVDPMKIGIVESEMRDSTVGQLLNPIQPYREQLTQAMLDQDCGNSTYITILDLALGTFSGAGALRLELGGVQATTAEINEFQFPDLGVLPDLPPVDVGGDLGATDLGTTDVATEPAPAPEGAGRGEGGGQVAAAEPIVDLDGARGGALAGVGGIGLALMLASAEGDRRKMRHAQHQIPLED